MHFNAARTLISVYPFTGSGTAVDPFTRKVFDPAQPAFAALPGHGRVDESLSHGVSRVAVETTFQINSSVLPEVLVVSPRALLPFRWTPTDKEIEMFDVTRSMIFQGGNLGPAHQTRRKRS